MGWYQDGDYDGIRIDKIGIVLDEMGVALSERFAMWPWHESLPMRDYSTADGTNINAALLGMSRLRDAVEELINSHVFVQSDLVTPMTLVTLLGLGSFGTTWLEQDLRPNPDPLTQLREAIENLIYRRWLLFSQKAYLELPFGKWRRDSITWERLISGESYFQYPVTDRKYPYFCPFVGGQIWRSYDHFQDITLFGHAWRSAWRCHRMWNENDTSYLITDGSSNYSPRGTLLNGQKVYVVNSEGAYTGGYSVTIDEDVLSVPAADYYEKVVLDMGTDWPSLSSNQLVTTQSPLPETEPGPDDNVWRAEAALSLPYEGSPYFPPAYPSEASTWENYCACVTNILSVLTYG